LKTKYSKEELAMNSNLKRTLQLIRAGMSGLLGATLPKELHYPARMQLRYQGRQATPKEIARVYLEQSERKDILFFIHGLMFDETCWQASGFNMTEAFEGDFDIFAVHVRYNTGLHISENGLEFAHLMEEVFRNIGDFQGHWHIVAHSMGGLVSRSALHQAEKAGMGFTKCVDKVFLLGTPNRGAPLEKAAHLTSLILKAVPYPLRYPALALRIIFDNIRVKGQVPLSPIGELTEFYIHRAPTLYLNLAANILELRSDGIQDMRHGHLLQEEREKQEEWGGMKPLKVPVPPLPWARYYAVAGTLSKNEESDPSVFLTDGMVSTASAANIGKGDLLCFVDNNRYHLLPGVNHFVMPFCRDVYQTLSKWLADDLD
jgi:pimeloyl-ACP methyl ester carboxylesterase